MKPKRDSCGILNQIERFTAIFFVGLREGETSFWLESRRWTGSWTRVCPAFTESQLPIHRKNEPAHFWSRPELLG
jgi:hypothetical protein